jgi:phosphoribosylaminoimidazole-succinocarboxamide synthase
MNQAKYFSLHQIESLHLIGYFRQRFRIKVQSLLSSRSSGLNFLADIVPNHIISDEVPESVSDRAVIVQPLEMFAIECVARGYLTGSGLTEYSQNQQVCGNALPAGLLDGSELPATIFTPATKAEIGDHDINIDFAKQQRLSAQIKRKNYEI